VAKGGGEGRKGRTGREAKEGKGDPRNRNPGYGPAEVICYYY